MLMPLQLESQPQQFLALQMGVLAWAPLLVLLLGSSCAGLMRALWLAGHVHYSAGDAQVFAGAVTRYLLGPDLGPDLFAAVLAAAAAAAAATARAAALSQTEQLPVLGGLPARWLGGVRLVCHAVGGSTAPHHDSAVAACLSSPSGRCSTEHI